MQALVSGIAVAVEVEEWEGRNGKAPGKRVTLHIAAADFGSVTAVSMDRNNERSAEELTFGTECAVPVEVKTSTWEGKTTMRVTSVGNVIRTKRADAAPARPAA